MKSIMKVLLGSLLLSAFTAAKAANQPTAVKGEEVVYTSSDGVVSKGYVSFDANEKREAPRHSSNSRVVGQQ